MDAVDDDEATRVTRVGTERPLARRCCCCRFSHSLFAFESSELRECRPRELFSLAFSIDDLKRDFCASDKAFSARSRDLSTSSKKRVMRLFDAPMGILRIIGADGSMFSSPAKPSSMISCSISG